MLHAAASATAGMRIKRFFCAPSRPPSGFALPRSLLIAGSLVGGNALALGLGAVSEQSLLGEPLRIVIPVLAEPGEEPADMCVRIVPSRVDAADGMPAVVAARVALEKTTGSNRLVVTTPGPVNDLAIRLTVHYGCERSVQREYVILFDPPLVAARGSDAAASPSPAGAALEAPISGMPASQAAPASSGPSPPATTAPRAAVRARGDEGLPPAARRSAVGDTGTRSPTVRAQAAPRGTPQLVVSRTVQATGRGGSFSELSKSAQVAAIREEEVVLQKRIDELSEQVQRMQQDRIAELTAQVERLQRDLRAVDAAQRAAEAARRDAPWARFLRWLDEFWPVLAAVFVLTALIAGILAWRRRRIMENALSSAVTSQLAGMPDTISEQAYGDDSLVIGTPTIPRRGPAVPRAAPSSAYIDTRASPSIVPEEDFELDITREAESDAKPPRTTNR